MCRLNSTEVFGGPCGEIHEGKSAIYIVRAYLDGSSEDGSPGVSVVNWKRKISSE